LKGGTGADSIPLGAADLYYYTDGHGHAMRPPTNQIENPDPQPGTNNWYTQDGYSGGTYSNCSDPKQPGVATILNYLAALPGKPNPNCAPGHYYLLNNYDPGYNATAVSIRAPVHYSAFSGADNRRHLTREEYLVEILWRRLGHLRHKPQPQCLLQHLQSLPLRDGDHD
jgi:hypothetical protein